MIPILFGIVACTQNKKKRISEPNPLYAAPQIVDLDLDNGYTLNNITGDSIQQVLNNLGDTVPTGTQITITGKMINPDSITQPIILPALAPEIIINAHPNRVLITHDLTIIPVNQDSFTKTKFGYGDPSFVLLGEENDTIPSGISIPAIGEEVSCLQPKPIKAEQPSFRENATIDLQYFDIDHGMTSSYIWSMIEDSKGNIWFSTNGGGVSRYDGEYFTHYTQKEGLCGDYIRSIIEDSKGNLWFGSSDLGVSKYDGIKFTNFDINHELHNNTITSLMEDSRGNIWLGSDGGGVSRFDGESFTHFTTKEGLSNNSISSILEDKNGNIWFSTLGGGINLYDGLNLPDDESSFTHFTTKEQLNSDNIWTMLEDSKGNLWFGTIGGGVSKYDGENFIYYTEEDGLANNSVFSIAEDDEGSLYFGTRGSGVNKLEFIQGTESNQEAFTLLTEKDGLTNNVIISLLTDSHGNLWFGTWGGGVNKYNIASFTLFTENEGLSGKNIRATLEDSQGNLWFASDGRGVSCYDGETFTHFTKKEGLCKDDIMSMVEDKHGNIWFGSNGGGASYYNGKTFTNYAIDNGLSSNFIWSLYEDHYGNIWFGTEGGGVTKYDGNSFTHFTIKEGMSDNDIPAITEDVEGNIWFGTWGAGISRFSPNEDGTNGVLTHFSEKEGLSNNFIWSIIEDNHSNIWIGTWGGGVNKLVFDKEFDDSNLTYFTEDQGLSNNTVHSLWMDKNNKIWIGTESGLNQLTPPADDNPLETKIYSFDKKDGLKGVYFYPGSVAGDSKNRVWWGTGKGLEMLNMKSYSYPNKSPEVRLNWVEINDQFIDFYNLSDSALDKLQFDSISKFTNYPSNPNFLYTQNHLTFYFSGIDWSAPHKIQYSYIIEGLDSTWTKPEDEAKADYRNLPYGDYTFKVCAIGGNGEWSQPFEYPFSIQPPWWHRWWARTGYVIGIILLILGFVRWRTAKLKQRQRELEKEIEIATLEIREQKTEVEKQKEIIEETHQEITDSIAYAKRLQDAILPSFNEVDKHINSNFILFKPKDIVSGDFYWFEHVNGTSYIASADCTGHGVPGAMVSVVCSNALNRSVNEFNITDPSKILDKTRDLVIKTFAKSGEDVKDGMDIALCAIKGKQLVYSGANNPLWIVRKTSLLSDQQKEEKGTIIENDLSLIEFKANKQPIGLYEGMKNFTEQVIEVFEGDTLYFFTDGFADQFGGEKGKKFKYKPFKKLLISINPKTMKEQKQSVLESFDNWKGNFEQVDDVCVIGIKI